MKYVAELNGKNVFLKFKKINEHKFELELNDTKKIFDVNFISGNTISLISDNRPIEIFYNKNKDGYYEINALNNLYDVKIKDYYKSLLNSENGSGKNSDNLYSVMPGKVVKILVEENQTVKKGNGLIILEAMKMENEIKAQSECIVKKIHVNNGESVEKNTLLIELENLDV